MTLRFEMVQQTKDSTFTKYGLVHAESSLSNCEKQLPMSVAAKKAAFSGSHNENIMIVSNPIGAPLLVEDSGCSDEVVAGSGAKAPIPESMRGPPKNSVVNGHLVYVRRKPDAESAKSKVFEIQSHHISHSKISNQVEPAQQDVVMSEPINWVSDASPLQRAPSPGFSSTRRSPSPSIGTYSNISSTQNVNTVLLKCANPPPETPLIVNKKSQEERYCGLLSFLKKLDQSNQDDYVKMLRSLSAVELSKQAVELEKRSIRLSLEEAKELQRVGAYDVLGKYARNSGSSKLCNQPEQQLKK